MRKQKVTKIKRESSGVFYSLRKAPEIFVQIQLKFWEWLTKPRTDKKVFANFKNKKKEKKTVKERDQFLTVRNQTAVFSSENIISAYYLSKAVKIY